MYLTSEIDSLMFNVDMNLYKKFIAKYEVEAIAYTDLSDFDDKYRSLKYPVLDHSVLCKTKSNGYILVSNPYLSDEECKALLKGEDFLYTILGKSESFYNPGATNLVVIYLEEKKMEWVYAGSEEHPKEDSMVICDLGKSYAYSVMKYTEGVFYDLDIGEYYNMGTDVKRWAELPKHFDDF